MGKNRLELRRMAEAAEKLKKTAPEKTAGKKKATKRKAAKRKTATRKTKERGVQRKRMVWCVYNGSMKEEGRFPYDQKEAAEAKLELLRSKSKKLFFLQAVKEAVGDSVAPVVEVPEVEDEVEETVKPAAEEQDQDEDALDDDDDDDDDDDEAEEEADDDDDDD